MVLSGTEIIGISKQPTIGSAVAATIMMPILPGTLRISENFEPILDQGRRGKDALDHRSYQGVGHSEISWDGLVQEGDAVANAPIGYLIDNLFGAGSVATKGAISGSGVSTKDHRLRLGTTKEYLTVEHTAFDSSSDRQFEGCRVTELTIRFNGGEGAVTYSVTLQGRSPTSVTAANLTDQTGDAWMGWQGQCVFAGTNSAINAAGHVTSPFARITSGEWTFRRSPSMFYSAQNSQNVTDIYLSPLEVVLSLVLDYPDVTEIAQFRNKTQSGILTLFEFTSDGGAVTDINRRRFAIGSILMDLGDGPAELDNSEANMRLGIVARGLYSATAGFAKSTGHAAVAQNSPVEVQIVGLHDTIF